MSLSGLKKTPLISLPFLKKRLRSITALGIYNLTVNAFNFSVYFTLHRSQNTVAFYTSELIANQRSPEWFYLNFPISVQCLKECFMRIWIKTADSCRLFLEYDINLDHSLVPDEQKRSLTRENNSLWLEMFGYRFVDGGDESGIQINIEDIPFVDKKKRVSLVNSYNILSIQRMDNIISSIRTKQQTSLTYLKRLQTFVEEHDDYFLKIKERESRHLRNENLRTILNLKMLAHQRNINAHHQRRKTFNERKNLLTYNRSQLDVMKETLLQYNNSINQSKDILLNLTQIISCRQKDIMKVIYRYIYPIERTDQDQFTIANIKLHQADDKIYYSNMNREHDYEISAGIRYCSHLVLIISQLLQLPLAFPIDYYGMPIIKIYDYSLDSNEFPLYPTTNYSAFRYAFYLLNRNIAQIIFHCQRDRYNIDIRYTLENLKHFIEQYFVHSTDEINNKPQLNSESTDDDSADEDRAGEEADSTDSSLSLIEYDADEVSDLFSSMRPEQPRLLMQVSQQ